MKPFSLLSLSLLVGFGATGIQAQTAYPVYATNSPLVVGASLAADSVQAFPAELVPNHGKGKGNGQAKATLMIDPGDSTRVTIIFPVYTDGYKITGTLNATVMGNFTVGAQLANGVVSSDRILFNLDGFDANGNYSYPKGIIYSTQAYYYQNYQSYGHCFVRLVYHHGFNTNNTMLSYLSFGSPTGIPLTGTGQLVEAVWGHGWNEGGQNYTNYILTDFIELPQPGHPGVAQVSYGCNHSYLGTCVDGDSYLAAAELYEAKWGTSQVTSVPFELFFANYIKSGDVQDCPIPGMGPREFGQTVDPTSCSLGNITVSRFTKIEYKSFRTTTTYIDSHYGGDPDAMAQALSNSQSKVAIQWPIFNTSTPDQILDQRNNQYVGNVVMKGGRPFLRVKLGL